MQNAERRNNYNSYIMKKPIIIIIVSLVVSRFLSAQINDRETLSKYIENPSIVEENQLPPHVPYVSFETVEQALAGDWERTPFYHSLNGSWKFYWTKTPLDAPDHFYMDEFDASDWDEIEVPGTWQMHRIHPCKNG